MGGGASSYADVAPPPDAYASVLTKDFSNGIDRGHVWALHKDGSVLYGNFESFVWTWSRVRHPENDNLVHLSSTHLGCVWGVSEKNKIYFRGSHMTPEWQHVKFPGRCVKLDTGGLAVWAIDDEGCVYFRDGVDFENAQGKAWKKIDGRLSAISVSPNMHVVGLNKSGKIFFRSGVRKDNIIGDVWEKINGAACGVAFGEDSMWAWNRAGNVFFREGISRGCPAGLKWSKCDGSVSTISAGSGCAYACDTNGYVMRRRGIEDYRRDGTDWEPVECSELTFSILTVGNVYRLSMQNSAASAIKAKIATIHRDILPASGCSWLEGSCGVLDDTGAFVGGRVLYTWQMARKVLKLRMLLPGEEGDRRGKTSSDAKVDDVRKKLSPKAARALSDMSPARYLRTAGLGAMMCDGSGDEDDDACLFYCDFANKNVDYRGYMDTSTVYLRSAKSGKYVNLDKHTRLPHCNSKTCTDASVLRVHSDFETGDRKSVV